MSISSTKRNISRPYCFFLRRSRAARHSSPVHSLSRYSLQKRKSEDPIPFDRAREGRRRGRAARTQPRTTYRKGPCRGPEQPPAPPQSFRCGHGTPPEKTARPESALYLPEVPSELRRNANEGFDPESSYHGE